MIVITSICNINEDRVKMVLDSYCTRFRQDRFEDNMFVKFLFAIALVAVALAQTSTAQSSFPDLEGNGPMKLSQGNLVLPDFEDENSAQNPSESGNSPGSGNISGSITSFPVPIPTGSNGGQQTTEEVIAENTEDLSGQATTSSNVVTKAPTRRPGLGGLFEIFGNAAQQVIKENADRWNSGVNSILGAGQSMMRASNEMRDAKMTAAASIPRGWRKVFQAIDNQE